MIEFQFKLNEICGELAVTSKSAYQEIAGYYRAGDFFSLVESLVSMAIWKDENKRFKDDLEPNTYTPKAYAEINGITDIYISVNDSPPKRLF
ncbi:hypothetical protein P7F88_06520 [Vibrio hannami]|uniref:hypothetical protein n=1 Tax=Vibrio hannami TaxID=2717094 RepID=UPI00240EEE04|nr:hypothetical protein [Vibrio hannami]MDG3085772.1 hypothetical protein [Vibrio hannami]